ncbi:TLC domain-containing protein 3 [Elsinoe fawcettii]|nr:TLC domain-containing protein 3 [Elsinoe fawcettii]
MRDPFPFSPPPAVVQDLVRPLADRLNLPTLPLHIHEIVFAVVLYTFVHVWVSPRLSSWLCPKTYPHLDKRTRMNWDVHVVSLLQSIIVCGLSCWVMIYDEERKHMNWEERVWGYTGAGGLLTSMACGYFIYDAFLCGVRVDIFGYGMLAHGISALAVFSLGYRPFVNYYAPIFLFYELSSPFNNFHWFLDKLQLTGSFYQWVNGLILIATFFSCRLVWGNYNSVIVFHDMWTAYKSGKITTAGQLWPEGKPPGQFTDENDIFRFTVGRQLPLWLAASYLGANLVLNSLNVYWMGKMIETIRKRFDPPFGTKGVGKGKKQEIGGIKRETPTVTTGTDGGRQTVEVEGKEVRSRRRG